MKTETIIDLIKTSHGYSIVEDPDQTPINKPPPLPLPQQPANTSAPKYSQKQKHPQIAPKKFIPQQTFTIYPYINAKPAENHAFIIIPSRTQWFNLNSIHQIERKALPEWFKQKKGLMASMNNIKFEKNQELYKKYRNYIIELGKLKYINATMARKGLAGDACSIIRIHQFLQKWGLINFVYKKKDSNSNENDHQSKPSISQDQVSHQPKNPKRRDGFDRDKALIAKIYDKDDLELLRKITKCFRPVCTSCESYCGIAWYEYRDQLIKKSFPVNEETSTVTVVSEDQFEYQLKVCFSCYAEKNYPVVLTVNDFVKKSIIDQIKEINFDQKYGKKKVQEWLRVAETVEKNKFNIAKCAQVLKMEQNEVVDILVQMPVTNLQKMSRIQQQTDDQDETGRNENKNQKGAQQNGEGIKNGESGVIESNQDLKTFRENLEVLNREEKKHYEEFLQAWLLKMYSKLEQLEEWDKAVEWRLEENESEKKHNIAEKMRKCIKME